MNLRQRQPRYENRDLLDLAYEIDCTFEIPGVCIGGRGVPCHSNKAVHGKGKSKKADDHEHASGCAACHHWYDFGPASREEKDAAFERARTKTWRLYWLHGLVGVRPGFVTVFEKPDDPNKFAVLNSMPARPQQRRRRTKTGHQNGHSTERPSKVLPRRGFA